MSENKLFGLLFDDDFVRIAEIGSASQSLMDIVHNKTNIGDWKPT